MIFLLLNIFGFVLKKRLSLCILLNVPSPLLINPASKFYFPHSLDPIWNTVLKQSTLASKKINYLLIESRGNLQKLFTVFAIFRTLNGFLNLTFFLWITVEYEVILFLPSTSYALALRLNFSPRLIQTIFEAMTLNYLNSTVNLLFDRTFSLIELSIYGTLFP